MGCLKSIGREWRGEMGTGGGGGGMDGMKGWQEDRGVIIFEYL